MSGFEWSEASVSGTDSEAMSGVLAYANLAGIDLFSEVFCFVFNLSPGPTSIPGMRGNIYFSKESFSVDNQALLCIGFI
jgi:hypothetical protein